MVKCSKCGSFLRRNPPMGAVEAVLGPTYLGNVCLTCGKVFCAQCITVGGPTPCPDCGRPTEPAMRRELELIGVPV